MFKNTSGNFTSRSIFFTIATVASLVTLSGCGQDRNLTEYRSSQVELELSKYRSIEGTYRGLAYQQDSRKPLGEIEVQLFANKVVDSDGLRNEARAVLQSYITLRIPGLDDIALAIGSGYFIPQDGDFKTTQKMKRFENDYSLQLGGKIHGDSLEGTLSVFEFPLAGLSIEVEKNREWAALKPGEFAKDKYPFVAARQEISYNGTANYMDGRKFKATLKLLNNSGNMAGTLMDILSTQRSFTALIDIDKTTLRYTFSPMIWDMESRTLNGRSQQGGANPAELRTDCVFKKTAKSEGWSCTYTSSLGGILNGFEFERPLGATPSPRSSLQ